MAVKQLKKLSGLVIEQTETETHVLYDKKTKEKARKRKSWGGSQNQSINQ